MGKREKIDRKDRDRKTAITKLIGHGVLDARKKLRAFFADNGFDYTKTGHALGCHHYTIRRWARALDMTTTLANDRNEAIAKGLVPNVFGRPKKTVPNGEKIAQVLGQLDYSIDNAAAHFGVSTPTFRMWCKTLGISTAKPEGATA